MKKILITLLSVMCLNIIACTRYETEITELYSVEKYKIHDAGVEIWAVSESGEEEGIFVEHENVYPCEEESSRVVAVYDSFGRLKNAYLYLSKSDMKDYVREKFEL